MIFEIAGKQLKPDTVGKPGREVLVHEALDQVCTNVNNFKFYRFSPPHMIRACVKLLQDHEETLEELLMTRTLDA